MAQVSNPVLEDFLMDRYWKVKIKTYDVDGNCIYYACNRTHGAATDATTWSIWKYTWVGGNETMEEGPLQGSVDDQATLAWR